jgi:hypothetical protein
MVRRRRALAKDADPLPRRRSGFLSIPTGGAYTRFATSRYRRS